LNRRVEAVMALHKLSAVVLRTQDDPLKRCTKLENSRSDSVETQPCNLSRRAVVTRKLPQRKGGDAAVVITERLAQHCLGMLRASRRHGDRRPASARDAGRFDVGTCPQPDADLAEAMARAQFWRIERFSTVRTSRRVHWPLQLRHPVVAQVAGKDFGQNSRSFSLFAVRLRRSANSGPLASSGRASTSMTRRRYSRSLAQPCKNGPSAAS